MSAACDRWSLFGYNLGMLRAGHFSWGAKLPRVAW